MYAYGFALLAGNLLLNVILKDTPFDSIFGIAISIASGVLGNKIYNIHVTKKITEIKAVSSDSEMASRRIAYSGGVNIAIPIIFGILAAFLVLLIILGVILAASSLNGFSY